MKLSREERATAQRAWSAYKSSLSTEILTPIEAELDYARPPATLRAVTEQVEALQKELDKPPVDGPCDVVDPVLPALKRVLMVARRAEAQSAEALKAKTTSPELLDEIDGETRQLTEMLGRADFASVAPVAAPRLSQFLKIGIVEERLAQRGAMASGDSKPKLDEKFGVLRAPDGSLADLGIARTRCGLRGRSLGVAYIDIDIDIDGFGQFNREHTETKIDRLVLPQFMQVLEAHAFGRGAAYRFGGDEHVMLLVNVGGAEAVAALDSLRIDVASQSYPGISRRTTVSIGYCEVDAECALTDREIVDNANVAKNSAKRSGRNRVATFDRSERGDFVASSLKVVAPQVERCRTTAAVLGAAAGRRARAASPATPWPCGSRRPSTMRYCVCSPTDAFR